jgi:transcription termination/antitermination protein NusG
MVDIPSIAKSAGGWLVVWTESRAEKKVASRMSAMGLDHWLPTITERHRWSDRWRNVVLPLFPGYLFVRADSTHLHQVLRTPGVLSIVRAGERPALLSDSFVHSLRTAVEQAGDGIAAVPERHQYAPDDVVVVQDGPLAGLRGVVQQLRGARHLVVWSQEIGRGVAFTIGVALVAPSHRGSNPAQSIIIGGA